MVECFDRIHLRLAETVLQPLRTLHTQRSLTTVTVRPPGRGPRIHVTVSKTWPGGPDKPPAYIWTARETDTNGDNLPDGRVWGDDSAHDTPETAYWTAVDTVAAARRRSVPA